MRGDLARFEAGRRPGPGTQWNLCAFVIIILYSAIQTFPASNTSAPIEDGEKTEFAGSVDVRLGTISVTVLDRKGQPVTGLNPGDFVLFVDDQRQAITNFVEVREGEALLKTDPSTTQPGQQLDNGVKAVTTRPGPRLLAVVVDTDNISIFNRNLVLMRAQQFIKNSVQPPHLGMVLTNERYPEVYCPPTTDSGNVIRAIESLLDTASGGGVHQHSISIARDKIYEEQDRFLDPFKRYKALALARMTAHQIDDSLRRSVETLKTICRALGGFEGKKDVLYVSDGLPLFPGGELFRLVALLFKHRQALTEMNQYYRGPLFEELANQAVAADVTLHTIDARGLITELDTPAERRGRPEPTNIGHVKVSNYQEPLRYLSAQTGGIAIVNTNEFEKRLEQVEDAITRYYSLGFLLEPPNGNRWHSIKIVLPDHSDHKARYRSQFLERSAVNLTADRTMTGLLVDPPNNALGIAITTERVVPKEKKVWTAEVLLKVPLKTLATASRGDRSVAGITLFAVAGSERGRSPMSRTRHSIALIQDQRSTFLLQVNLELGPGLNRISIGVLDEESGLDGFAVTETTLPK